MKISLIFSLLLSLVICELSESNLKAESGELERDERFEFSFSAVN